MLPTTRIRGLPRTSSPSSLRAHYSPPPHCQRQSLQSRTLWGCSRQRYDQRHDFDRDRWSKLEKLHRYHYPPKPRPRAAERPRHADPVYTDYQSWKDPGWSWGLRFKSRGFPEFHDEKAHVHDYSEAQKTRPQERLERVRKDIDADPYGAIFGRRLQPFGLGVKLENTFTALCRSFLGLDKAPNATDIATAGTKPHFYDAPSPKSQRPENGQSSPAQAPQSIKELTFEFDPISGRMVPKTSNPLDESEQIGTKSVYPSEAQECDAESERLGFLSPVDQKVTLSSPMDVLKPGEPVVPESLGKNEGEPANIIMSQDEFSVPVTKSQANSATSLDQKKSSSGAIQLGPPRAEDEEKTAEKSTDMDESNILRRGKTFDRGQYLESGGETVPEKLVGEHQDLNEDFERSGFLSRRENAPSKYHAREDSVQERKDDDLDSLQASDIRAAYESMRLSHQSEAKEENPRVLIDSSDLSTAPTNDTINQSKSGEEGGRLDVSSEPSSITANQLRGGLGLGDTIQSLPQEETSTIHSSIVDAPTSTEVYRVFAYDPSSLQVTEAETSSSRQLKKDILHPTEVLSSLNNPAKFLPCLDRMHVGGYEIVSGGGDILVFKKALRSGSQDVDRSQTRTSSQEEFMGDEPTTHAASHQHNGLGLGMPADRPSSNHSPCDNTSPKSGPSELLRKMLVGSTATAATVYAISIVAEYFRTGGEDGRGIDGFTEFESERRHR
ncbi:hypothetical protein AOCH_005758 [Aspergillus ochraceoroseus]|uniref:Serine-threonine rich protein n=1 Tax=Aspergillus ochraceoroseus TaxID=138278 RepID=A0A0F8V3K7_9EURO|nr:hypothetical protein AOCH_005758 [Aspergillus ochraceoroseus]